MLHGFLVPATLMVGTVSAAALPGNDFTINEVPDYGINLPGNTQKHLNVISAEKIHSFWSHTADNNVRYLMIGEQCRQSAGLMTRVWQVHSLYNIPILYREENVPFAMSEMSGDHVSVLCNSDFHDKYQNIDLR
jgi:hypothetical protein